MCKRNRKKKCDQMKSNWIRKKKLRSIASRSTKHIELKSTFLFALKFCFSFFLEKIKIYLWKTMLKTNRKRIIKTEKAFTCFQTKNVNADIMFNVKIEYSSHWLSEFRFYFFCSNKYTVDNNRIMQMFLLQMIARWSRQYNK